MLRAGASPAVSVERFFQASLLGLVASGYLAVAGSGYLDLPTVVLTGLGLLLRVLMIYGLVRLEISERAATYTTIAYSGFYLLDYLVLSRAFLAATVHLVFFLAVAKILTAQTNRDHLYTAAIAFLELVAAAILSVNFNFFVFLTLYLLFAMAALMSGEIRRSMHKAAGAGPGTTARSGLRRFHSRLAGLAVFVSAGIMVLTGALFFVLPRTADAAFSHLTHRMFLPGFSTQVTLGEIGEIKESSQPVMHIHLWGQLAGGLKWRGGTLADFDGRRWSNLDPARQTIVVADGEADLVPPGARPLLSRGINYDISYDEISTDALFFAGSPQSIRVHVPRLWRSEGGYRLMRTPPQGFHYAAYSVLEEPPESAPVRFPLPVLPLETRERCLQTPRLDPRVPELARQVTEGLPGDLERARAIERYLRTEYGYTLQLPDREAPDPLAYFLFTRKKGHCEYFASAMAVLLRTLGIPARLATGFQSGVFNSLTDLWVVRASDAHTWVEAWIPSHGWTTFDPTPADPNAAGFAVMARLGLYLDAAETFWRQWVVGYDAGQQGSLADRFEQGAHHMGLNWFDSLATAGSGWSATAREWGRRYGIRVLIVLAMAVWSFVLVPPLVRLLRMRRRVERVRRGQASAGDATLLYERMLAVLHRHGYQKPVWFTPAEFAASLAASPLGGTVSEFTAAYNEVRFGGRRDAAPRLSTLLDELERARP